MKDKQNKITRITLSVNDEPFILETERELTNEYIEYLEQIARYFFSRNKRGDEDTDYRITLSPYEIIDLYVTFSNEVKDLKLEIRNCYLELFVIDQGE